MSKLTRGMVMVIWRRLKLEEQISNYTKFHEGRLSKTSSERDRGHVASHYPQGVIYKDKLNRKRLRRSDELHKFIDGILQLVWDTLHDMATNLRMGYNKSIPRRSWSNLDKTRAHIMVSDVDRQLMERMLMEGNTGKTLNCFSRQYDFVILCSTLSSQFS
ncbi:hypothetical protein Tco_0050542 [Tanacetum coccineum]